MNLKRLYIASLLGLSSVAVNADTLQQVYETAKYKDPIILKSKAQYDVFVEQVSESKSVLLPQIGFGLDANHVQSSISTNTNTNYGASLDLTQSLYNGTYWQQTDIAEKQATQYAAIYGYAAQDLLFRAATAYFDVLRADESVKSVKANKRAVERQLEQTKQRFDVGLIAITDVHEAQAEYDRTVADLITAENTLANNYYLLRELTGEDVKQVAYLDTKTFDPQPLEGDVKIWRNKALEYNLDLHNKRIAKELAKMNIELAEAGHEPTLNFTAGLGYNDYNYHDSNSTSYDATAATFGLSLNVPIYTGGGITSRVKQAQFNYVVASEDLIQSFRSIDAQINSGYNNVQASLSSIRAYEQTVVSSQSALDAAEASFEVGTRTIVDVLDATRNLYSSENLLANARYDYIINMLQLKLSAGTLSEKDIFDISAGLTDVSMSPDASVSEISKAKK
ncbi:TolC family outer membrane protein [Psychromonas sp. SR45-3]|uniref:TolC family outer membrane protein n=1 Tax=Psychromonas sp. SR45-3 TaxID=2760930 RepID=UPI0015FB7E44|nr:TolC family outer membrane protein [Psychromonas sp. SR45-3]MBB1273682.1 TolC family outer membrane protein [Psychromonas sp. SR45-3]